MQDLTKTRGHRANKGTPQPDTRTIKEILEQDYLPQDKACERLQCSRFTLHRRRREGSLKGIVYDSRVYISLASIKAFEANFVNSLPEFRGGR